MMMKKGIGKRAKEILRKLLQGRGMRRLAIGLALIIPVAGYVGDVHGWAAGKKRVRSRPMPLRNIFPARRSMRRRFTSDEPINMRMGNGGGSDAAVDIMCKAPEGNRSFRRCAVNIWRDNARSHHRAGPQSLSGSGIRQHAAILALLR